MPAKVTKSFCQHCQRAVYPGTHKFGCPEWIDHSTIVPTEPLVSEATKSLMGKLVQVTHISKEGTKHHLYGLIAEVMGYDHQPMVSVHRGNLPTGEYVYLRLPKLPEYEGNMMAPVLVEHITVVEEQVTQAALQLTRP